MISTHLLLLFFFFFLFVSILLAQRLLKSMGLCRFKSDQSEFDRIVPQVNTHGLIFDVASYIPDLTVTSLHAEKYSHLMSAQAASATVHMRQRPPVPDHSTSVISAMFVAKIFR